MRSAGHGRAQSPLRAMAFRRVRAFNNGAESNALALLDCLAVLTAVKGTLRRAHSRAPLTAAPRCEEKALMALVRQRLAHQKSMRIDFFTASPCRAMVSQTKSPYVWTFLCKRFSPNEFRWRKVSPVRLFASRATQSHDLGSGQPEPSTNFQRFSSPRRRRGKHAAPEDSCAELDA